MSAPRNEATRRAAPGRVRATSRSAPARSPIVAWLAAALLVVCAPPLLAIEEPPEPPPEAPEGVDYEAETADSIEAGSVEMGFAAVGRAGRPPSRRQSLRFRGGGTSARVREGSGDPLAGASLETGALGGRLGAGRMRPRWGRGLLFGAAADPWSRSALADEPGAVGARGGEGLWYQLGDRRRLGVLAGHFDRRAVTGGSFESGACGVAGLMGRATSGETRRRRQASTWFEPGAAVCELALDGAGRWRAEGVTWRDAGPWRLAMGARGGTTGFRSLAEPRRAGPSRAISMEATSRRGAFRIAVLGALWRFRPGCPGARGALEVGRELAQHDALVLGFEEQQGVRRDPFESASRVRSDTFRQGLWGEWRAARPELSMTVRHEVWGERRFARAAVRTVSAVRVEAAAPWNIVVRVTHSVYRARSGESLYLAEAWSDRLVLRAVSGAGERTRFEVQAPAAGGNLRAAVNVSVTAGTSPRPQWTLDWTRRARTR